MTILEIIKKIAETYPVIVVIQEDEYTPMAAIAYLAGHSETEWLFDDTLFPCTINVWKKHNQ